MSKKFDKVFNNIIKEGVTFRKPSYEEFELKESDEDRLFDCVDELNEKFPYMLGKHKYESAGWKVRRGDIMIVVKYGNDKWQDRKKWRAEYLKVIKKYFPTEQIKAHESQDYGYNFKIIFNYDE